MADVRPFPAVRYNPEKVGKQGNVIAPPYDIIDKREEKILYERHPNNVIRLILPDRERGHTEAEDDYHSARLYLDEWLQSGVLSKDEEAYYITSQEFEYRDVMTRWGILAAVGLEEYDNRVVIPHEATMDGPKEDRFKLMEACRANLSPVFCCYFDPDKKIAEIINKTARQEPVFEATEEDGVRTKMWKLSDPELVAGMKAAFADKKLYIADGHHRYETCLALKYKMMRENPDVEDAPWMRTLMYLVDFEDPGMVIRPYHRAVKHLKGMSVGEFLDSLDELFYKTMLYINPWRDGQEARERARNMLAKASENNPAFALIAAGDEHAYILVPKPEAWELLEDMEEPLRNLDASVLKRLAFEEILEISEADLREGKVIMYDPDWREIWKAVRKKGWALGFFLNPVKPQQVTNIAEAGLIMPQKSTYFYPKIPSGLVIHRFF